MIILIGSITLWLRGETISSKNLEIFPGGKGLNQSIALAKAGAEVYHAGQIGKDGLFLKKICEENGVCVSYIRETDTNTGNAIIQVADSGQNGILLFPGQTGNRRKPISIMSWNNLKKEIFCFCKMRSII